VEGIIENTSEVAKTRNALNTHKKSGWKASFMKFKREADKQREEENRFFRENLQKEIEER